MLSYLHVLYKPEQAQRIHTVIQHERVQYLHCCTHIDMVLSTRANDYFLLLIIYLFFSINGLGFYSIKCQNFLKTRHVQRAQGDILKFLVFVGPTVQNPFNIFSYKLY